MYIGLHTKYPLFSTDFSKNTQMLIFMKIRPVGAELFHADGWTDIKKLTVVFRNFANAPKNFWHKAQDV